MDCWRQWIRNRTANVNEYSTRYSNPIDAAQKTPGSAWRAQSQANRQGSGDYLPSDVGATLSDREAELQAKARAVYNERIDAGVAREQARKDLPLSTYTEAYWKIDLHNLLHFLDLRMDAHAQAEIREYAMLIGNEVVSRWCPLAWEAFQDYVMGAVHLTRFETTLIAALSRSDKPAAIAVAIELGILAADGTPLQRSRERVEIENKLTRLGFAIPWQETT
jgi:thymidylate synthase (FAD)